MRAVRGSDVVIASPTFTAADGDTPTDTTGTPTCTVTREDGTALAAAVVTDVADDEGNYTARLTAAVHTTRVDVLTVTWEGTADGVLQSYEQTVEVVGSHYFTLPEMREEPSLGDTGKVPAWLLREVRDELADLVEDYCGVAFVPRYHREQVQGRGCAELLLSKVRPRELISVTIDGSTEDVADYSITPSGVIVASSGFPRPAVAGERNVTVTYEHGHTSPPPRLRRELLRAARQEVLARSTKAPTVALSQTVGDTTTRFAVADARLERPTGYPSLDALLNQLSERHAGLA